MRAIRGRFPELLLAYHGHNTDGNDLSRMTAGVLEGVKIVEVADHGYGCIYSQAPALSLIQTLRDYGFTSPDLKIQPLVDCSDVLRRERRFYERFESPYRGFDPTVKRHKLTGGAASMAFEQAEKLGLLERIHEVFSELIQVNSELGNIWSVTPGSQILWTTGGEQCGSRPLRTAFRRSENGCCWAAMVLSRSMNRRNGSTKRFLEHHRQDGKKWYQILADEAGISSSRMPTWKRRASIPGKGAQAGGQ